MLEKYLSEKNVSLNEIQNLFPDLNEILSSYSDIAGAEGFELEVDKIGREIVSMLKERESQIDSYLESRPFSLEPSSAVEETITAETDVEEPEIKSEKSGELMPDIEISGESFLGSEEIEMGDIAPEPETTAATAATETLAEIEEAPEDKIETEIASPEIKMIGIKFTGANFQQDMFLKILSVMGMDFSPKAASWNEGKIYWVLNDSNYFITDGMPFNKKVDVWAVGEKMTDIIQSKVSYESKEEISDAPDTKDLEDIVYIEDKEPITGLTFKQVDESVLELFKVDSAAKLMTLLELGRRKFECGCGHI